MIYLSTTEVQAQKAEARSILHQSGFVSSPLTLLDCECLIEFAVIFSPPEVEAVGGGPVHIEDPMEPGTRLTPGMV